MSESCGAKVRLSRRSRHATPVAEQHPAEKVTAWSVHSCYALHRPAAQRTDRPTQAAGPSVWPHSASAQVTDDAGPKGPPPPLVRAWRLGRAKHLDLAAHGRDLRVGWPVDRDKRSSATRSKDASPRAGAELAFCLVREYFDHPARRTHLLELTDLAVPVRPVQTTERHARRQPQSHQCQRRSAHPCERRTRQHQRAAACCVHPCALPETTTTRSPHQGLRQRDSRPECDHQPGKRRKGGSYQRACLRFTGHGRTL